MPYIVRLPQTASTSTIINWDGKKRLGYFMAGQGIHFNIWTSDRNQAYVFNDIKNALKHAVINNGFIEFIKGE